MLPTRLFIATVFAGLCFLFSACGGDNGPAIPGGGNSAGPVPFLAIGGGADEQGVFAHRTPDGGYLVVGLIGKPRNFFNDIHAVRLDLDGAVLGQHPVRRGDVHCNISDAVGTADGGVVAITTREDDAILIKFAPDGSVLWERNYGSHAGPTWHTLCTAGDGFLVAVVPDVWADLNTLEFIRTYSDGTERARDLWVDSPRRIFSVAEARDGSFILAGSVRTTPSNLDIFVARTEPGTMTEYWAGVDGTPNSDYIMQAVALGNDVVMFGTMDDPPDSPLERGVEFLARLDPGGRERWIRNLSKLGYLSDITADGSGGLAVVAHHVDDGPKIALLNGNGAIVWERSLSEEPGGHGSPRSIVADAAGFVMTGSASSDDYADTDMLLASVDDNGNGIEFPAHEPECLDPVTPPPPNPVPGIQRSYSVAHSTGIGMDAIWALSSDFVVAVGDSGYIALYDGSSWSRMESNTREELFDVYGFARNDVFVAARHGKIFHYDGVSWSEMPSTATYLISLWGAGPNDVWAGGVQLMHYDGVRWTDKTPKGWWTPIDMDGITATDIYSVGAAGRVQRFDGCTWSTVYEAPDRLYGVSAIPGPLVHCVGDAGLIVRYGGDNWHTLDLQTNEYFTSAWARSENDVFIAGTSGFAGPYVLYWFDGTTWRRQPQPTSQALYDLTGTPDGNVFGATTYSYIVRGIP